MEYMPKSLVVYRIAKKNYIEDLSGAGSKINGGRWNSPGFSVLYCSSTISLALIEILCYTPMQLIKNHFAIATIEILNPKVYEIATLPAQWNTQDKKDITQKIGNDWILSAKSHVLKVPSAVITKEFNFLVNPKVQGLQIQIKQIEPLIIDSRLKNNL